jgi:hypothetical protein
VSSVPPEQPDGTRPVPGAPALYRAASATPALGSLHDEDELPIPWPRPQPRTRQVGVTLPGHRPLRPRPPAGTRGPLPGLLGLLVFAVLGGFFGWVSAEPAWLALGHGRPATATVTECGGSGLGRACTVTVAAPGLDAAGVRLVGVRASAGQQVPVRVVGRSARVAYAGSTGGLVLRALVGLLLVLACGAGTGWVTGAARLPRRRLAWSLSAAVPVLLAGGVLAASW